MLLALVAIMMPSGAWAQTNNYTTIDTEAGTLTIDGTLGGKTEATEDDITALVEQLKEYVYNGITTIIVPGSEPAMIDVGSYSVTAIGEAIYRLSGSDVYDENNPYNGKIDLILSDVTEIVEWDFYNAFALNSITLPKVTTIGDQAFQGCDYLKQITFGSVIKSITQENGITFVVGDKVDGCDLVLNCGQLEAEDTYKPNLDNNVWFKPSWGGNVSWKSITLTHGEATPGSYVAIGEDGHTYTCSVCKATVTEAHTVDVTTGKCSACGAEMPVVATVTDGTNTYYAIDETTLNQAVTAILETGSRTLTVDLPADADAEMITAIRRAICDTEGVTEGSIHLTLKGVTSIPGTTNWDGIAFGPGDIYDEAGKIVDQELVTQLASVNLPDVTEIGAQAFYFCENLAFVSAPKAQTIGAQALGYTVLTSVEFPELTTIPTDMFSGTWTLSSAKFPKVTTIEQSGLLVGAKFKPENNPTPFPLELTAEGDITFNGSNHFNIASQNYSGKVDLVLCCDKSDNVTFHDDGTATWLVRDDLSYTFKSITFKHSYVDGKCKFCNEPCPHTGHSHAVTAEGSVITKACLTCGTILATATIECPDSIAYGEEYAPTVTGTGAWADTTFTVGYFASEEQLEAQPTEAGTYSAFITVSEAVATVEFTIVGNATSIDNSQWTIDNSASGAVYDLQGRRVTHPTKGIYIVNGRKVVIK